MSANPITERSVTCAAVLIAATEAKHAERNMQMCIDMAAHWAQRADYWREQLHRFAEIVEAGARELAPGMT